MAWQRSSVERTHPLRGIAIWIITILTHTFQAIIQIVLDSLMIKSGMREYFLTMSGTVYMILGSEFFQENHAKKISTYLKKLNPPIKMNEYQVIGHLVCLWEGTQSNYQTKASRDDILLHSAANLQHFRSKNAAESFRDSFISALIWDGLLTKIDGENDVFEIRGNAKKINRLVADKERKKREREEKKLTNLSSGRPSDIQRTSCVYDTIRYDKELNTITPSSSTTKVDKAKKVKETTDGSKLWEVYRASFHDRYNHDPARNQKTNTILKKLVEMFGVDEASNLICFYLTNNDPWSEKDRHTIGKLMFRAETLYNEMKSQTVDWSSEDEKQLEADIASGLITPENREAYKQKTIMGRQK